MTQVGFAHVLVGEEFSARALPDDAPLPLFAHDGMRGGAAPEQGDETIAPLPLMPLSEHVLADYQTIRLSLKAYPTQFLRAGFEAEGIASCAGVAAARDGAAIRCAGMDWMQSLIESTTRVDLFSPEHDDLTAALFPDAKQLAFDGEGRIMLPEARLVDG